jgi:hypothetical protein
MQAAIAAVVLLWSNNDISGISFLDVDEGMYVKYPSSNSSTELMCFSVSETDFNPSLIPCTSEL